MRPPSDAQTLLIGQVCSNHPTEFHPDAPHPGPNPTTPHPTPALHACAVDRHHTRQRCSKISVRSTSRVSFSIVERELLQSFSQLGPVWLRLARKKAPSARRSGVARSKGVRAAGGVPGQRAPKFARTHTPCERTIDAANPLKHNRIATLPGDRRRIGAQRGRGSSWRKAFTLTKNFCAQLWTKAGNFAWSSKLRSLA